MLCLLVILSPRLENVMMYWFSVVAIVLVLSRYLVDLRLAPLLLLIASAVIVVLAGVAIQVLLFHASISLSFY